MAGQDAEFLAGEERDSASKPGWAELAPAAALGEGEREGEVRLAGERLESVCGDCVRGGAAPATVSPARTNGDREGREGRVECLVVIAGSVTLISWKAFGAAYGCCGSCCFDWLSSSIQACAIAEGDRKTRLGSWSTGSLNCSGALLLLKLPIMVEKESGGCWGFDEKESL